jgi:hypothetical protein
VKKSQSAKFHQSLAFMRGSYGSGNGKRWQGYRVCLRRSTKGKSDEIKKLEAEQEQWYPAATRLDVSGGRGGLVSSIGS